MGGFSDTPIENLARGNDQKINYQDDYTRREQDLFLSANPELAGRKPKILDLYQRLWKFQSKMDDMIIEARKLMNKIELAVENIVADTHEEGREFSNEERWKYFDQLVEVSKKLLQGKDVPLRLNLAKTSLYGMTSRVLWELKMLMPDTDTGELLFEIPSKLVDGKLLHEDLTIGEVFGFYESCCIYIKFLPNLTQELCALQWKIYQEQIKRLQPLQNRNA